jgi:DNA-binding transcriptional MerR regulator
MTNNFKSEHAYKTIGELTKELGLIDKKTGNLQTHTLRYWETQFKQIKPSIRAGNRRYYSYKDIEIINKIKFLLKDKGFTIKGVKKLLNNEKTHLLDGSESLGIYKPVVKNTKVVKEKIKKIRRIVKELKKI